MCETNNILNEKNGRLCSQIAALSSGNGLWSIFSSVRGVY